MRHARRTDANQREIVSALRAAGAKVKVVHEPFDLHVSTGSKWAYFEVKNPKTGYGRKGPNEKQRDYAEAMADAVFFVDSVEFALACLAEMRE